jgi:hypothetical protein
VKTVLVILSVASVIQLIIAWLHQKSIKEILSITDTFCAIQRENNGYKRITNDIHNSQVEINNSFSERLTQLEETLQIRNRAN